MNSLKRVLILGATSAIAEHVARQLAAQGASLYCIGRSSGKLLALTDDLRIRAGEGQVIGGQTADLLEIEEHSRLISDAEQTLGGLDAVLIAYGSLPDQKACEKSFSDLKRELEVNSISVISLLTELGNRFEQRSSGVIAVISSVAGDRGRQSNYVYGAAKGMLSIFLQGLRNRLSRRGVSVVTIKPGFVDTPMTADFAKSGPLWAKPDSVAKVIVSAMAKGKSEVYVPWFWAYVMFIIRHIPESMFKRMSL